ncbi:MAG: hypothetical protein Q4B31_04125 [Clostridia bacterium]|nr:hypothetical protein [Clostridia bacterium]
MSYIILIISIVFVLRCISYGVYEVRCQNISGGVFTILWSLVSLWALYGLIY